MTHDVQYQPVWWPNGMQGVEVVCRTCHPVGHVLWQSPETGYDPGYPARVAEEHQAGMRKKEREGQRNRAPLPQGEHDGDEG